MGREQTTNSNTIFLSVSFGKFRQKKTDNGQDVTEQTPGAVVRTTKSGNPSWSIEYDAISGYLDNVFYKESQEFGNSYEVIIKDGIERFQISIKEKGNFMQKFLTVLPNIVISEPLRIKVWDYEGKDRKRKVGLIVEQDNNPNTTEFNGANIVNNYYGKWENKKFVTLHGFPSSENVEWHDEENRMFYNMKVRKFLRNEFDKLDFSSVTNKTETEQIVENVYADDFDESGFPDAGTAPEEDDNDLLF